ncbi:response regulator transcription factor [Streptomyces sp. B8F3]|uniref:response regulator transcription factor n=1 Tax=unclassified Streptomyces TaxID=2593676 RepID=UPI00325F3E20
MSEAGTAHRRGPKPRLLVVEDEPNLLEVLAGSLRYAGFDTATAATGQEALAEARRHRPDAVVLDVMLPDMDGFEVLRQLRAEVPVPVLFLTARDATEDKVRGLTIGGDDYITKPFSLDEVIARIHVVLRRQSHAGGDLPAARLSFADLELDQESHEVRCGGARISLSPTEFKLLRYFMANPGRVLSKAQILDQVWSYDFRGDGGIVETYVHSVRRKIGEPRARLIHTVRGVGYVLRPPS